jgi:hypothetical protein
MAKARHAALSPCYLLTICLLTLWAHPLHMLPSCSIQICHPVHSIPMPCSIRQRRHLPYNACSLSNHVRRPSLCFDTVGSMVRRWHGLARRTGAAAPPRAGCAAARRWTSGARSCGWLGMLLAPTHHVSASRRAYSGKPVHLGQVGWSHRHTSTGLPTV